MSTRIYKFSQCLLNIFSGHFLSFFQERFMFFSCSTSAHSPQFFDTFLDLNRFSFSQLKHTRQTSFHVSGDSDITASVESNWSERNERKSDFHEHKTFIFDKVACCENLSTSWEIDYVTEFSLISGQVCNPLFVLLPFSCGLLWLNLIPCAIFHVETRKKWTSKVDLM